MAPLVLDKNGIEVRVRAREHLPPHVHAFYGDDVALVEIRTGEIFKGFIPEKKLKIVQEWLAKGDNRKVVEQMFYDQNPTLAPKEEKDKKQPQKKKVKQKKKGGRNGK